MVPLDAVHGGFRVGQRAEHPGGEAFRGTGQRGGRDQIEDLREVAGVPRLGRLDHDLPRPQPVPPHHLLGQPDVVDAQPGQAVDDPGEVRARVDQRGQQHVAGAAVPGVDPRDGHGATDCRATRAAATPAPKPLSMLTVTTPGAQLFSMVRNAVRPSRCQP